MQLQMPRPTGPVRTPELVDLSEIGAGWKLDLRYASSNNFLERPLYPVAKALMQRPAAEALARVQGALARQGLGLLIFDAYRPWSVTRVMAESVPPEWVGVYLANPLTGSRHNRGCAVDLTLFDLATGQEVDMPTAFDDFSPKAGAYSEECTPQQAAHRELLQQAMEAEGFSAYEAEWWHFDYKDWRHYEILDVPLE